MDRDHEIKARMARFVSDVVSIVERVRAESLDMLRASLRGSLPQRQGGEVERAVGGAARKRRSRRRVRPAQGAAATHPPAGVSATRPPVELGDAATGGSTGRGPAAVQREALVLDAVRCIVRPTAAEVVERTGLPNGSVHVALRALLAAGRVVRTATARGKEYSLVSAGSVRPFKRASNGASAASGQPAGALSPPTSPPGSEAEEDGTPGRAPLL